jgi:hypothetical protein
VTVVPLVPTPRPLKRQRVIQALLRKTRHPPKGFGDNDRRGSMKRTRWSYRLVLINI